ncbi:MAG: hypothetical protein ACKV22_14775 [Bryobacteraceae bacterium]
MEQERRDSTNVEAPEVELLIKQVVEEYRQREQANSEPAYKAELLDERRRREQLERRLNELVEENNRTRRQAEEAERSSAIRSELQRAGVQKVDLAYKAIHGDVVRTEDGRLIGNGESGAVPLKEFVLEFVQSNPEFLPARISGGSGTTPGARVNPAGGGIEIEKIRPGMSRDEMERARLEILRVASQTLKGQ